MLLTGIEERHLALIAHPEVVALVLCPFRRRPDLLVRVSGIHGRECARDFVDGSRSSKPGR